MKFETLEGLALGSDGSIYFGDRRVSLGAVIRKIGPDGIVRTIAGGGAHCASNLLPFDGPARNACFESVWFLSVGRDGTLYIPDQGGRRVRTITPDGIARTIFGNGKTSTRTTITDGGIASGSTINSAFGAAIGPDGGVYVTDNGFSLVRRIAPALPRFTTSDTVIPSADGTKAYVFDGSRHLRTVHALTGATLSTYGYDPSGQLVTVTDFDGNVTEIERDTDGRPTAIVAPGGQRTTMELDQDGYLARMVNPAGEAFDFTHTSGGLLTEMRTPRGHAHTFTHDADGRLESDEGPTGSGLRLTRSGSGDDWSVTTTTAMGLASTLERGRNMDGSKQARVTRPNGLTANASTGTDGAMSVVTPEGVTVTASLKPDPRFGLQVPVVSTTLQFPSGRKLDLAATRSVTLTNNADLFSLATLTATHKVDNRTTTSTYDAATREVTTRSPLARTSRMRMDEAGRVIRIETPGLDPVEVSYSDGLLSSVSGGGRSYAFSYDDHTRLIGITDPLSRSVSFGYDEAGRVTSKTTPQGASTLFTYDDAGNIAAITPPGRAAHRFSFSAANDVETYTAPGAGSPAVTRYRYNADRQLTETIRADSTSMTFEYDSAGRPTAVATNEASIGFSWDSAGRLDTITAPSSQISHMYDGTLLTQVSSEGMVAGSVSLDYDAALRPKSETANGQTINFSYDGDDLLIQAGALVFTRNATSGMLTGSTLGSMTDSLTLNTRGDLMSSTAKHGATTVFGLTYVRDAMGRITSVDEVTLGMTTTKQFAYDAAGRIATSTYHGNTVIYTYDDNGNRLAKQTGSVLDVAEIDQSNDRLLSYGGTGYTYTANGELKSKTDPHGITSYGYDSFGDLVGVTLPGNTRIEYVYDALARRIARKVDGATTHKWLYGDGPQILAELSGEGEVVSRFVYASRTNVPDYMIRGGVTYRILADHVGSPRLIVNAVSGAVVQRLDYDEFGGVTVNTSPGSVPFGFAGGIYDPATGLTRFGARDYDAYVGRWTVKDSIGFDGVDTNLYAYALNDPINLIDPSGLLFSGTVNAGEAYGQAALEQYADILIDPSAAWYEVAGAAVGGFFSSLWTPCTSDATFTTLSTAAGAGAWARQPYWRYVGPNSRPNSPWLVRGWRPPYGNNYARAKDALQMPHMPTGVQRVNVPGMSPVRGPKPATQNPQWGSGGGSEYARGWSWPQ